ncbi:hypothetical protein PC111_g8899 [Phytophthora cactorum]|nr:hypothetical protein PC111_g8899 [Phytophthora cactorum]
MLDKRHDAATSGGDTDDGDVVDKRSRGAEGCESCAGPRPTVEEWKAHIAEYPLGEQERGWIGKYKHSLAENARASSRGGSHRHWSSISVSFTFTWSLKSPSSLAFVLTAC